MTIYRYVCISVQVIDFTNYFTNLILYNLEQTTFYSGKVESSHKKFFMRVAASTYLFGNRVMLVLSAEFTATILNILAKKLLN